MVAKAAKNAAKPRTGWLLAGRGNFEENAECAKGAAVWSTERRLKYRLPKRFGLVAILLDTGGAEARKPMIVDGGLPGQEFLHSQGVPLTSLFKAQ